MEPERHPIHRRLQRRLALAGSLQLSQPGIRERAREALVEMGLPADARAERLSPQQFAELAGKLYG